jgi:hypothetical protein
MAAAAAAAEPASDKIKNHLRPHELIPEHIKSREKIDVSIALLPLKPVLRVCPTQPVASSSSLQRRAQQHLQLGCSSVLVCVRCQLACA